ncbi:hypothetical protein [Sorangium sp. So ce1078]|uniref:hypothetical protein n=1 Tax=Sorangium sp. So ce1078 TaxID=3133329 RepID=UPI003F6443E8
MPGVFNVAGAGSTARADGRTTTSNASLRQHTAASPTIAPRRRRREFPGGDALNDLVQNARVRYLALM